MSQTYLDGSPDLTHDAAEDLTTIRNNFAALKSFFSGLNPPPTMGACTPWYDITNHVLKVRDDADSQWFGLMHGDVDQRIWVHRNAVMTGWALYSSAADCVLAVKGGSVYTTGGIGGGSWSISGLTFANHTHTYSQTPYHSHTYERFGRVRGAIGSGDYWGIDTVSTSAVGLGTCTTDGASTSAVYSAGTWRPAAAVGTIQRLAGL